MQPLKTLDNNCCSSTTIFTNISFNKLGKKCLICCTLSVFKLYQTAPGVVRPTALLSCLPQMMRGFVKGSQQCTVEFFQELLGENADHLQTIGLIPRHCNLEFLNSFSISLSSEVLCSGCNSVTQNSVTETVLPLPIMKVKEQYFTNVVNGAKLLKYYFFLYSINPLRGHVH